MVASNNKQQELSNHQNNQAQDQSITQEQLSDVYAAGTSDGVVQLAEGSVTVTNEGYSSNEDHTGEEIPKG